MKINLLLAFATLSLGLEGTTLAQAAQNSGPDVADDVPTIIDEEPEAFYVEAPWTLARRMRGSLKAECATISRRSIFCDGTPLRFLREVSVYGNKKEFGFACTRESLYIRNKYFTPEDIRSKSTCLWINCRSANLCEVDSEAIGNVNDSA